MAALSPVQCPAYLPLLGKVDLDITTVLLPGLILCRALQDKPNITLKTSQRKTPLPTSSGVFYRAAKQTLRSYNLELKLLLRVVVPLQ